MLFVADIGNSKIKLGVIDSGNLLWQQALPTQIFSDHKITLDSKLSPNEISICSVVPDIQKTFEAWFIHNYSGIQKTNWLNSQTIQLKTLRAIDCKEYQSDELGTDRLMNLYGALLQNQNKKRNKLIIDFGTMCTIDLLSDNHKHLGGIIMPGPGALNQLLPSGIASQLSTIDINFLEPPQHAIATNAKACLESGFHYGYIGMVEKMILVLLEEANWDIAETEIIATGGGASKIMPHLKSLPLYHFQSDLTLQGIENFTKLELELN